MSLENKNIQEKLDNIEDMLGEMKHQNNCMHEFIIVKLHSMGGISEAWCVECQKMLTKSDGNRWISGKRIYNYCVKKAVNK